MCADVNDCRDQCQNGGTCKVRVSCVSCVSAFSKCESGAAVVNKRPFEPNRQNVCGIPFAKPNVRGSGFSGVSQGGTQSLPTALDSITINIIVSRACQENVLK